MNKDGWWPALLSLYGTKKRKSASKKKAKAARKRARKARKDNR